MPKSKGEEKAAAIFAMRSIPRAKTATHDDELRRAFENRSEPNLAMAVSTERARERRSLVGERYDFVDVRTLAANPENDYKVEEDIEPLAQTIYSTKDTDPIVIWRHEGEDLIISGHRRAAAHTWLGDHIGEQWYMVLARIYRDSELSAEDAQLMLDAKNIAQRRLSPAEEARGVARLADEIRRRRAKDPELYKGFKTADIVAEQIGRTQRSTITLSNIGARLCPEAMRLYDERLITQKEADRLSRLPADEQKEEVRAIERRLQEESDSDEEKSTARDARGGQEKARSRTRRHQRSANDHVKSAASSLRRAIKSSDAGEIEQYELAIVKTLASSLESRDREAALLDAIGMLKVAKEASGSVDPHLLSLASELLASISG